MGTPEHETDRKVPLDALRLVWQNKLLNDFSEDEEYFNVYVDSPFCEGGKCRYCCYGPNIIKSQSDNELRDRYYEEMLISHIREFKDVLSIRTPDTVYFGGGTSSLMSLEQMDSVFTELQRSFDFGNSVKEKTFEFNPWHVTEARLQLLADWNFTHVTIGIQTFDERVLKLNRRSNPGLDRLISVMDMLEQYDVWYNVDLMTFINQDDLEQDLAILKKDLEITARILHPKRITVYPNYYKLRDPEVSAENRKHTFTKIRKLREFVCAFAQRIGYVEENSGVFAVSDEELCSNYAQQHSLIRGDIEHRRDWKLYSCSGWPNTNYHQNVLALGGYGKRRPYSYLSDRLCYETAQLGKRREYLLVYGDPGMLCDTPQNHRAATARNTFPNLRQGVPKDMLIYQIDATALDRYRDKAVTIRAHDDQALVHAFTVAPKERLLYLQVLSMDCDPDALLHLSEPVPIDLVMENPAGEFSRLYRFAELTGKHPVRVTVRAVPGMTKAVKVAQALNFSVKLDIGQPEAPIVEELLALADYYLRGPNVSMPVEPFHSLFLSFFSGNPTDLWLIQDEDPATDRYVSDEGGVALSKRLTALEIPGDGFESFLEQSVSALRANDECAGCDFFDRCEGYFKLPHKDYRCGQVKRLFALLKEAATELQSDEQRFVGLSGKESPGS